MSAGVSNGARDKQRWPSTGRAAAGQIKDRARAERALFGRQPGDERQTGREGFSSFCSAAGSCL